jgi:hypothetical protein
LLGQSSRFDLERDLLDRRAKIQLFHLHKIPITSSVMVHGQYLRQDHVAQIKGLEIFPALYPMHTFYWGDWAQAQHGYNWIPSNVRFPDEWMPVVLGQVVQ